MKKRVLRLLAACLAVACLLPIPASAAGQATAGATASVGDLDSSTFTQETTYTVQPNGAKIGQTMYEFRRSDGAPIWRITVSATFTYNASGGRCVYVYAPSVVVYDDDWCVVSKSTSRDGDTAIGSITMGLKLLSGRINELPVTLTLSCDKNGNLS